MALRLAALGLIAAAALLGQDPALESLSLASARVRDAAVSMPEGTYAPRKQLTDLHLALRDWIESRLPKTKAELDAGLPLLTRSLTADLAGAGLLAGDDFKYGTITGIELSRPAEYPEALLATTSAGAGRGPDDRGNRPAVLTRSCTTSEGCWNGIGYALYRLGPGNSSAVRLHDGQETIYCWEHQIRLKPDDFLLELQGACIDPSILIRAHVLHYKVGEDGAVRVDPVALQPRDFVDEWLTRPWEEMAAWSSANAREELKKWHAVLHSASDLIGDFG